MNYKQIITITKSQTKLVYKTRYLGDKTPIFK